MKTIDLETIIHESIYTKDAVADHLFPENKYPRLALRRVLNKKANLDSEQISKLSLMVDLSISELYGDNFTMQTREKKMVFTYGDYEAVLDTSTWSTKVFNKKSLFHEFILHKKTIVLSEYLHELNLIISKNK